MSRPGDPVRERVEKTLRELLDAATTAPCAVVRSARRTIAQPVAVTRTMVTLTWNRVFGRDLGGDGASSAPSRSVHTAAQGPARRAAPRPHGDAVDDHAADPTLPIEGYENLAASHIVARLARLAPDELNEIKEYELATRGRRTVVGRIDQLLAAE